MVIIYVLAAAAILLIIGTYVRRYFNPTLDDKRSEEEVAKEEVESMIVHQRIEDKDKKDNKND
ncbi:MAG: hypothetical protein SO253_05340 [Bacilli bacterium]|nr:hypothetical protein [Bacilli bacterium]